MYVSICVGEQGQKHHYKYMCTTVPTTIFLFMIVVSRITTVCLVVCVMYRHSQFCELYAMVYWGDVKTPTYKPYTNHKKPSVSSHTLAPTTICDLSHSACRSPLTDLGHRSSVTYVCHPLWCVCGHRKGILTSPHIQAV